MQNFLVKSTLVALFMMSAVTVQAAVNSVNLALNFDNVASGTTANSLLGDSLSFMHFGNGNFVNDAGYDPLDLTAPAHWEDASSIYGDVLVKNNASIGGNYAVSGSNVLWNNNQPILVLFNSIVNIESFSVQQDLSGFGNLQTNGSFLAFLDPTGHVISDLNQYYTQTDQSQVNNPGKGLLLSTGFVGNVSGILLSSGVHYDNLSIAAVPEADIYAMLFVGLGVMGAVARRRK